MLAYRDIDGDSGVSAYECSDNCIDVQFKGTQKIYRYSYHKAGKENVEKMKVLAKNGNGLNSFINTNVRNMYD